MYLIFTNHVNGHRGNLQSDMEKTKKAQEILKCNLSGDPAFFSQRLCLILCMLLCQVCDSLRDGERAVSPHGAGRALPAGTQPRPARQAAPQTGTQRRAGEYTNIAI